VLWMVTGTFRSIFLFGTEQFWEPKSNHVNKVDNEPMDCIICGHAVSQRTVMMQHPHTFLISAAIPVGPYLLYVSTCIPEHLSLQILA
jgi:hypothetical protein